MTEELAKFRQDVRTFLTRELTPDLRAIAELNFSQNRSDNARWHSKLFEAGWVAPSWPVEFGGTGWSLEEQRIFSEELTLAGAPMLMPFALGMIGPVLCAFGTDEQREQHLPGILDGTVWWCQGYSEPGSGSDLASLKTRAIREGGDYLINGQKIWTTNAHRSDWMFALVRTDFDSKPQQGITFLMLPMSTPGVEVKPIFSIDGLHHLNEVYFTNARVPVSQRIGEENKGWSYAKYLLGHERTAIANIPANRMLIDNLRRFAETAATGDGSLLSENTVFRNRLNQLEIELDALDWNQSLVLAAMESGGNAGDAASMLKIVGSELQQKLEELRVEAVAYYSLPFDTRQLRSETNETAYGPDFSLRAVSDYNFGRASSIYGGSNEIQRNVLAKSMLGF